MRDGAVGVGPFEVEAQGGAGRGVADAALEAGVGPMAGSPPYLQPTPTGICDRFKHLTSYGTPGSKYSSGVNSDRALYVVTGSGSSRHRFSLQRQGEPQS